MPLILVLVSLLAGVAFTTTLASREFVISWVDLAAAGLAASALVRVIRRREVVIDRALIAYGALFGVFGIQLVTNDAPLEIAGGVSRFVTASFVLVGLSQFLPEREVSPASVGPRRSLDEVDPWRWPLMIGLFGSALACWVAVDLVRALGDPTLQTFYGVKNAIDVPLGASNYLAGFLVVSVMVCLVAASVDRRFLVFGAVSALGLLATMSRGAAIAVVLASVAVTLARRSRAAFAAAFVVLGMAAVAFIMVWAGVDPVPLSEPGPLAADGITSTEPADTRSPELSRLDTALYSPTGDRVDLYRRSWQAFLDHPVTGVGLNRFTTVSADLDVPHVNAHNMVLHALATTGLLGALAYLTLWGVLAHRLWQADPGVERAALAAGAGALFIHAQVEALAFTRSIEVVLAVMLVLSGTLSGVEPARRHRFAGRGAAAARG